jgi:hypothetical protein
VQLSGTDPNGDVEGATITFLDASGAAVDTNGSGSVDAADDFDVFFGAELMGMTTFTVMRMEPFPVVLLGTRRVTQARIRVYDADGSTSAPLTVPYVIPPTRRARRDVRRDDDALHVRPRLHDGHLPGAGRGHGGVHGGHRARARRHARDGDDHRHAPDGHRRHPGDLCVSDPGTPPIDTVIYVRRTCVDPSTEIACIDDLDGLRAHVEILAIPAGTYAIFDERYGMMTAMPVTVPLTVTLRPVLATGAACDPAGAMNRCAMGPCPAMGTAVCP